MAFFTGVVIDESITGVAIPAALAEIAVFMKETISESAEVAEPPQTGVGMPSSAEASANPYFVGVKNAFPSPDQPGAGEQPAPGGVVSHVEGLDCLVDLRMNLAHPDLRLSRALRCTIAGEANVPG